MKTLGLSVLFFLATIFVFGQKCPVKFGDIPMEDLTMASYPLDPSAGAVVLVDYGEAYMEIFGSTGLKLTLERHVRIKILNEDGLRWANAQVPLYNWRGGEEKLSSLKASTFNLENGQIVETKMAKENLFKEKFNRYFNVQKFTLPGVKKGSIIEYTYKTNSDFFLNFPNWQFQRTIPTRHSEYWAIIPQAFIFEKYMQGYLPVTAYEVISNPTKDYFSDAYHWIIKDVPAFKEEPYMTGEEDYISRINFALSHIDTKYFGTQEVMGSWQKLNDLMLASQDFGGVVSGSGYLKKTVDDIVAGHTDPLEKVRAIHNYVKQNIEWTGEKDKFTFGFKNILETKKGSAADINLLLASMIEKIDLPVDLVLISTRDHGFVRKQYPMERQFNYVVCLVRMPTGNSLFLDGTDRFLPINMLPEYCLNGEGLVISKTNHGWINLETKIKAKTVINASFELLPTGELNGKLSFQRDGYDANTARKNYISNGEKDYLNKLVSGKSWSVANSTFENVKEVDVAMKESHELSISEHASQAGDVIYINPFITSQLELNPFKQEQRVYPVDYGSLKENVYMFKITIPEGFTVDEIPQSKLLILPNNAARFTFNASQNGNTINILSNLQINRNIFAQDEYSNLREFYNQVVAKQAEQIVIKKKL